MTLALALQGNIILIGLGITILMELGRHSWSPRVDSTDRTGQHFSELDFLVGPNV